MMKKILITGSNGYIASNFVQKFSDKYIFLLLSHKKTLGHITFDELNANKDLANSIDIIINLAGYNISDNRWNEHTKNKLLQSRIDTTQKIVDLFNHSDKKPHLISASAIGIYSENIINDEATIINYTNYDNFSQKMTKNWEKTAHQYLGKLTIIRLGVVLGGYGGAFPNMLRPFKFYIGNIVSTGEQYMPWIALPDLLNAINHIILKKSIGIYNLTSPNMINNLELSKCIAKIWHKPIICKIPVLIIKILFGQMGTELLLSNIKVLPNRLINEDFLFMYPELTKALDAIKNKIF